jgi:hypothetical protein
LPSGRPTLRCASCWRASTFRASTGAREGWWCGHAASKAGAAGGQHLAQQLRVLRRAANSVVD